MRNNRQYELGRNGNNHAVGAFCAAGIAILQTGTDGH